MNNISIFREWALAIAVLLLILPATATVRAFLQRSGKNRKIPLLTLLAPTIANLMYLVGLSIFAEVAPLNAKLSSWVGNLVYILTVLIGLGMFRRAALAAIEWNATNASKSPALLLGFIPLLRNLVTIFVFLSGTIMVLQRFNYDVMSLLAAMGIGSLAVGLAAKDTLSNMISGFTLVIDRNLKPGDHINLAGAVGDVQEIGLRSTLIRTGDGNTLIVPNSELVNTKILNLSMPTRETSCTTTLKVPFSVPFDRVKTLCVETISQVQKAHPDRACWIHLHGLADGYQSINVGFWLREMNDGGPALSEFNERLLVRFQKEQLSFFTPPTQVVALT